MEVYQKNIDFSNKLAHILSKEISIYNELLLKEQEKSKAIHSQNVKELLDISQKQESIFPQLENFEKEREEILFSTSQSWSKTMPNSISELLEWKEFNNEEAKEEIEKQSKNLKKVIVDLNKLTMLNQKMLQVNNEWFHTMINTLTSKEDISYTNMPANKNINQNSSKPIFINTSC